jgi:hypothetical protein
MNRLYVNWQHSGVSDGSADKPFKTIGEALDAMTGSMGGYVLDVAPGVYIENAALETPAAGLIVYGNGSTLHATAGITYKGKFVSYEFTVSGTVTLDGGSVAGEIITLDQKVDEKTPYGVLSGLAVSAQATPDMTVKISAGTIYMADGTRFAIAAKASQALIEAPGTNPRIDIIYVNSSGAIAYEAGEAAATPAAPDTPEGGFKLAEISVPANDTTISADQITDTRKSLFAEAWIDATLKNSWAAETGYSVGYRKDNAGIVRLRGRIKTGTAATVAFTLPEGYRPVSTIVAVTNTSGTGVGKVTISAGGDVTIDQLTTYIDLDGIAFYTV